MEEHFRKQSRLRLPALRCCRCFSSIGWRTLSETRRRTRPRSAWMAFIRASFGSYSTKLSTSSKQSIRISLAKRLSDVRESYFAKKKRRGGVEDTIDSTSGQSAEDRAAYNLIMKDKERLLSFDEPVAFIFSHSALREGWDNPNVCQICTLNQTVSEVKKRQEVGRGMRLVVNQEGQRSSEDKFNILTVVANESYEQFVSDVAGGNGRSIW